LSFSHLNLSKHDGRFAGRACLRFSAVNFSSQDVSP
jgi:hypothetical protein